MKNLIQTINESIIENYVLYTSMDCTAVVFYTSLSKPRPVPVVQDMISPYQYPYKGVYTRDGGYKGCIQYTRPCHTLIAKQPDQIAHAITLFFATGLLYDVLTLNQRQISDYYKEWITRYCWHEYAVLLEGSNPIGWPKMPMSFIFLHFRKLMEHTHA